VFLVPQEAQRLVDLKLTPRFQVSGASPSSRTRGTQGLSQASSLSFADLIHALFSWMLVLTIPSKQHISASDH